MHSPAPVVLMEAPTGHHLLSQPGRCQTVERGGERRHLTGGPGPQHLHLVDHVVQPGARIEELTPQHHQHVLSPAQSSHFRPGLEKINIRLNL